MAAVAGIAAKSMAPGVHTTDEPSFYGTRRSQAGLQKQRKDSTKSYMTLIPVSYEDSQLGVPTALSLHLRLACCLLSQKRASDHLEPD